ncbi:MAG: SPOR domain-containing protein [Desulfuromonadaceae bacterium]|nr:SPOR domain-containing protein [Desulfuromonadaceae bacterium]
MRIDYSDPKKSCSVPQGSQNRPRKEFSGGVLAVVLITGLVCLGIGFGSGWMLSQKSAKKGFQAAMEQQSLENSPQPVKAQPPASQPQMGNSVTQPPAAVPPPANDPPLSFYKTLPSGQKSNTLGSGINPRDEKPARQALQAAMPANVTKPAPPQPDEAAQDQPVKSAPVKPANTTRQETGNLTVQVASFSLRSEAETLRSKLAAKGYNVTIVESFLGYKGTWYRVRVGKHLDPDAAKELAGKLGKGAIAIPEKD